MLFTLLALIKCEVIDIKAFLQRKARRKLLSIVGLRQSRYQKLCRGFPFRLAGYQNDRHLSLLSWRSLLDHRSHSIFYTRRVTICRGLLCDGIVTILWAYHRLTLAFHVHPAFRPICLGADLGGCKSVYLGRSEDVFYAVPCVREGRREWVSSWTVVETFHPSMHQIDRVGGEA